MPGHDTGEYHSNNQTMAKLLHKAVGMGSGSVPTLTAYEAYQQHFADAPVVSLRDCLEIKSDRCVLCVQMVKKVGCMCESLDLDRTEHTEVCSVHLSLLFCHPT